MSDNIKIGAEVEIPSTSTQNIKSLKQQLREAIKDAQVLGQQDLGSKEAIEAQKRVAELKDRIDDTNEAINAFTGAGQFRAIGNAVQGIAGGFAAAQGAMALFGSDSEELQKVLVRLNAAMAFSQGLASMEGLADSFKSLKNMIVTNVIPALGTLRGALIATGIGAAAVAVGLLVSNWEKVVKVVREFIGLGPTQEEILEAQTKEIERQNAAIERGQQLQEYGIRRLKGRQREQAELTAAHTKEILAIQQKYNEDLLAIQKDETKNTDEKYEAIRRLDITNNANKEALVLAHEEELAAQREKFAKEDLEKTKANEQKKLEAFTATMYRQIDEQKRANETLRQMEEEMLLSQEQIDGRKAEQEYDSYKKSIDRARENSDAKRKIDLDRIQNEESLANDSLSILQNVNQIAGDNFEAGKAISVATATVDTYFAAQKAYSSQMLIPTPDAPVRATIAAAAAIVAGLARVAAMSRVRPNQGSSLSLSNVSAPTPPSFTPPTSTAVQGAGDVTVSTQQNQMKVFVVESDITNTQNRVRTIERGASLGG